jgi:hypothetical protein
MSAMDDEDIAVFLDRLRQTAQSRLDFNQLAAHAVPTLVLMFVGSLLLLIPIWTVWHTYAAFAGMVAGTALAYIAGLSCGRWLERRFAAHVHRMRRQVRANLLDRGLLLRVLDADAAAAPAGSGLQRLALGGSANLRERLLAFTPNYVRCCREANLPPGLDSSTLLGQRAALRDSVLNCVVTLEVVDALRGSQETLGLPI